MAEQQYPQRYPGQNYGQNFGTNVTQQQQYAQQQEAWRRYYQQQQQQYNQIPGQAQMTPQQQQYGQQIKVPEREHEDYRSKINFNSRTALIALIAIFGVIFIVSLVYFMMPKQQAVIQGAAAKERAPSVVAPTKEMIQKDIEIDELKFCSDIDENFYCYEEDDNTFDIGGSVYVYVRIKGFSQVKREEGYLIGIRQDVETLDPEGISVYQLSGTAANIADFLSEGQNYLHLKTRLRIPAELKPGAYTFRVTLKDKITDKTVRMERGFWLE